MRISRIVLKRLGIALVFFLLLAFAVSFTIATVLAEGALHPPRLRRPSDTATLARHLADAASTTAARVAIRTPDGITLVGWWLTPNAGTRRAVLLCHGVADSALGVLGDSLLFLHNGYAVLAPESRGHGESGGLTSYGVLESKDTLLWLAWMEQHGVQQSFGLGESLGGAILLQSLAQGASLHGVVAECAYSSFRAIAEERVARFLSGNAASILVAKILVEEAFIYTRLRYRIDLAQADTAAAVSQAQIPILLIHGMSDYETSPANSKAIHARNPRHITLWLVPDAGHTGAYAAAPKEWESKVLRCFSSVQLGADR